MAPVTSQTKLSELKARVRAGKSNQNGAARLFVGGPAPSYVSINILMDPISSSSWATDLIVQLGD